MVGDEARGATWQVPCGSGLLPVGHHRCRTPSGSGTYESVNDKKYKSRYLLCLKLYIPTSVDNSYVHK